MRHDNVDDDGNVERIYKYNMVWYDGVGKKLVKICNRFYVDLFSNICRYVQNETTQIPFVYIESISATQHRRRFLFQIHLLTDFVCLSVYYYKLCTMLRNLPEILLSYTLNEKFRRQTHLSI